jgi:hypothetical protein
MAACDSTVCGNVGTNWRDIRVLVIHGIGIRECRGTEDVLAGVGGRDFAVAAERRRGKTQTPVFGCGLGAAHPKGQK